MPAPLPPYSTLPTKDRWKRDLDLTVAFFGHKKSPLPSLERVGRLLEEYYTSATPQARPWIMFHLYSHTCFLRKNRSKQNEKLGGTMTDVQYEAVVNLNNFVLRELDKLLGAADSNDFEAKLVERFGKAVTVDGSIKDDKLLEKKKLQYYTTDDDRGHFKLSFRNGQAHKKRLDDQGLAYLEIYDTIAAGDGIDFEFGFSLFVMDRRGRLYVSGKSGAQALQHSSFMGGDAVLAAGTMRVEQGIVRGITGRSGHYQPSIAHMINVIERLRTYQVNLREVKVYRTNMKNWMKSNQRPGSELEPCAALDLLNRRAWPSTLEPNNMWVMP